MSRQDNSRKGKTSGRGAQNSKSTSSARGNAPLRGEGNKKSTARGNAPVRPKPGKSTVPSG